MRRGASSLTSDASENNYERRLESVLPPPVAVEAGQAAGRRESVRKKRTRTSLAATANLESETPAAVQRKIKAWVEATRNVKRRFLDPQSMKEEIRRHLAKPMYNVVNFYKEKGIWQYLARSQIYEYMTLVVISLNAIWIAVDLDYNKATSVLDENRVFTAADNFFCFYFTFEILVRFMAFKMKCNCLKDGWFVFDSLLVLQMVLETWVLSLVLVVLQSGAPDLPVNMINILRLARLLRLARIVRLFRSVPTMIILLKAVLLALYAALVNVSLLVIVEFVFSVIFVQLTQGPVSGPCGRVASGDPTPSSTSSPAPTPTIDSLALNASITGAIGWQMPQWSPPSGYSWTPGLSKGSKVGCWYFPDVWTGMYYLTVTGLFYDSLTTFVEFIGQEWLGYGAIFFIYMLLAALIIQGLLIAVLASVVQTVATIEKEEQKILFARTQMQQITAEIDTDGDMLISQVEFKRILENRDACVLLKQIGVDPVGLLDFAEYLFSFEPTDSLSEEDEIQGRVLTVPEFLEALLQLRGDVKCRTKDTVETLKMFHRDLQRLEEIILSTETVYKPPELKVPPPTCLLWPPLKEPDPSRLQRGVTSPALGAGSKKGLNVHQTNSRGSWKLQLQLHRASGRLEAFLNPLLFELKALQSLLRSLQCCERSDRFLAEDVPEDSDSVEIDFSAVFFQPAPPSPAGTPVRPESLGLTPVQHKALEEGIIRIEEFCESIFGEIRHFRKLIPVSDSPFDTEDSEDEDFMRPYELHLFLAEFEEFMLQILARELRWLLRMIVEMDSTTTMGRLPYLSTVVIQELDGFQRKFRELRMRWQAG